MKKKILIFSIGAAVLLILTCFPSAISQPIKTPQKNEQLASKGTTDDSDDYVLIKVIHRKEGGKIDRTEKKITKTDHEAMMTEIKGTAKSGLTLREIFEESTLVELIV